MSRRLILPFVPICPVIGVSNSVTWWRNEPATFVGLTLRLEELYLRPDESGGGRFELKGMGFRRDQVGRPQEVGGWGGWGGWHPGLWVLGLQPMLRDLQEAIIAQPYPNSSETCLFSFCAVFVFWDGKIFGQ